MSFVDPLEIDSMAWTTAAFLAGVAYLILHFVAYLFWLRTTNYFQTERGILFYHSMSATIFTVAVLGTLLTNVSGAAVAAGIGLVAAHGIYSVSFLELWSLTEGSYSISILNELSCDQTLPREAIIEKCAQIGQTKKATRLVALARLGLLDRNGEYWQLSARGRLFANFLQAIKWISAINRSG